MVKIHLPKLTFEEGWNVKTRAILAYKTWSTDVISYRVTMNKHASLVETFT